MRGRTFQRGQALIIIMIGALFLGGASATLMNSGKSASELRKEIGHLVQDEGRALRADGVVARMDTEAEHFASEHHKLGREALELMARHDARPGEFEALLAQADALNARSRKALVDLRFELRQDLSPEEWRSLFSAAPGK